MGMGSVGGRGRKGLATEINVTPLVDVMLVLLIIFMVTAPMMTQGIDINLPRTTAEALRQQEEPLVVKINSDGQMFLGENNPAPLTTAALQQELDDLPPEKRQEPVYLQADRDVPYGAVVQVMAQLKRSGFEKLGMVTLPDEENGGGGQ